MQLSIIRHLQTAWNAKGIMQGSRDIAILPPTESVRASIEENKQRLCANYDVVLASPYQRTQQTAAAYGFSDVLIDSLLVELNFGEFEGQPKVDMIKACGDAWVQNPKSLVLGEPFQALEDRIKAFLKKYLDYDHVLVFGHGSWMRALNSIMQHGDIRAMNQITISNNTLLTFNVGEEVDYG